MSFQNSQELYSKKSIDIFTYPAAKPNLTRIKCQYSELKPVKIAITENASTQTVSKRTLKKLKHLFNLS